MFLIYKSGQVLKERIDRLKEKSSRNEMYKSESEFSEEMMDIRKDLVTIHGLMVLLKNYSSLNFAGRTSSYLLVPIRLNLCIDGVAVVMTCDLYAKVASLYVIT